MFQSLQEIGHFLTALHNSQRAFGSNKTKEDQFGSHSRFYSGQVTPHWPHRGGRIDVVILGNRETLETALSTKRYSMRGDPW